MKLHFDGKITYEERKSIECNAAFEIGDVVLHRWRGKGVIADTHTDQGYIVYQVKFPDDSTINCGLEDLDFGPKFKIGDHARVGYGEIVEIIGDHCYFECERMYQVKFSNGDKTIFLERNLSKLESSEYRPFRNAEEVMEAIKEHGDWVKESDGTYVTLKCVLPDGGCGVMGVDENYSSVGMLNNYNFSDGAPFGARVE